MPDTDYNTDFLDTQLGVTAMAPAGDDPALAISDSDRATLRSVAAQPTTGVQTPGAPATDTAPDYLKDLLDAPNGVQQKDWKQQYTDRFGADKLSDTDTVDADRYYADLTADVQAEEYLNTQTNYRAYADFLSRTYEGEQGNELKGQDDLMLLQNAVKADLGAKYTDAEYDRLMGQLQGEEGALNPDGQRRVNTIRQEIAQQAKAWEAEAQKHGKQQADATLNWRKEFAQSMTDAKIMGNAIDPDDAPEIQDFVLNGDLDAYLNNLTPEALRELAVLAVPKLRAKYYGLKHYERGAEEKGKTLLARRLN